MRKGVVLFFLILNLSLSASTYYIDPSGNDNTGNGSSGNPWKSLYKACNSVRSPGDIIHVNAGIYIETNPCDLAVNVSIEGEGENSVIVSHYQSTGNYEGIIQLVRGTNGNQHISNIKLDGDNLTGYQAICIYDRDNVSIHDCIIVDFRIQGIKFGGGTQTGNSIYNNSLINCAGFTTDEHACLSINDNSGMLVYNNYIAQNSRPDGQNGTCIESWHGLKGCKIYNNNVIGCVSSTKNWSFALEFWMTEGGIEIYNNKISGHVDFGKDVYKGNYEYGVDFHHNIVGWDELQDQHTDGIQFEQTIESVIVRNNLFKNLETPIYFCQYNYTDDYVKDIYIFNNLMVNVGMRGSNYGSAIFFESGPVPPIYENNINIWNNTIIADRTYPTDFGIWIPSSNRVTNISIKNNIIAGFTNASIYASLTAPSGFISYLSIENNLFYNNGNNNAPKYVRITPSNVTYRNNIVGNPYFVSSTDFHLTAQSPGFGTGVYISDITTDFEDVSVSNPPNIGCYATVAGIPAPSYISSSIENNTPSTLQMNFDLALANIVPPIAAFNVQVNSAARNITSVTVSGAKVLLTLASPVAYGNSVTVAYTKPSNNPLQTPAGGQAASFSAQSVSNKINPPVVVVNTPPIVVVNSRPSTYSGFVGTLDATGSYDTNKDKLTFAWKVPPNIQVSATDGPILEFLAPVVDENKKIEFTVTVSDGKATQIKTVPVIISPYQPELEAAEVVSVKASDFQSPYYPYNIMDGNVGTMWSAIGSDQWIILELSSPFTIQHVKLAFQPGQRRESYFDILGSTDTINWEPILIKSASCSFSGDLQVFDFPASKAEQEFKYIKLVGQGNSANNWNYIAEFRIFGYRHKNPSDYQEQLVKIYPNPAHELVNILIDEQTFVPDFLKIVSLSGKVIYNNIIEPEVRQLQIPVDFKQGVYIVQMGTNDITMFTQKLIITK